jgi:hypothetical protein
LNSTGSSKENSSSLGGGHFSTKGSNIIGNGQISMVPSLRTAFELRAARGRGRFRKGSQTATRSSSKALRRQFTGPMPDNSAPIPATCGAAIRLVG